MQASLEKKRVLHLVPRRVGRKLPIYVRVCEQRHSYRNLQGGEETSNDSERYSLGNSTIKGNVLRHDARLHPFSETQMILTCSTSKMTRRKL